MRARMCVYVCVCVCVLWTQKEKKIYPGLKSEGCCFFFFFFFFLIFQKCEIFRGNLLKMAIIESS